MREEEKKEVRRKEGEFRAESKPEGEKWEKSRHSSTATAGGPNQDRSREPTGIREEGGNAIGNRG